MLDIATCNKKWIWSVIFIRIPKNASTSIFNHLGNLNLIKKYEQNFLKSLNNKTYRNWFSPTHAKPNEIREVIGNAVHNYMSFAVVRNPYDRMVSMFHFARENSLNNLYGIKKDLTFNEFCFTLLERHEANDSNFIANHCQCEWLEGAFKPNFILSFENLQEDFTQMLKECNIKHISPNLPKENSTKRSHYKDYFTTESKKITEKIFERDFERFKYHY